MKIGETSTVGRQEALNLRQHRCRPLEQSGASIKPLSKVISSTALYLEKAPWTVICGWARQSAADRTTEEVEGW